MGDGDAGNPSAVRALDDIALEEARYKLWRDNPDASAAYLLTPQQVKWPILLAFALVASLTAFWHVASTAFSLLCSAFFVATLAFRILAGAACVGGRPIRAGAWREAPPRYTILCPLRGEHAVVAQLLSGLQQLRYPTPLLDIKLILEADDPTTQAAVAAHALPSHFEILLVPTCLPRTKPKALNYALATARGAFVTVFDAEDRPHPDQLLHALGAFAAGGDRLGALQAPILIDNSGANWLTRQFAEYALQFLGAVPLLTRLGLTPPLGGTSNHFRREALDDVVAWDPFNVTEDADLGFRLACRGWAIGAIAAPTYEGAPVHLRQWINQRSRWIKGYLQTWIVLMRRPKRALHELGLPSFVAAQLILLGGSFSALAHAPFTLWLAWSALHGEAPAAYWILCMAGVAAGFLTSLQAAAAARDLGLGWAALTAPLYWLLGFPAAAKALFELVARPHYWDKTAHGTPPSA